MYMLIDVNAVKRKITKTKPEQSNLQIEKNRDYEGKNA